MLVADLQSATDT